MKANRVLCIVLALCMMLMSTDLTVLACEPTDVQVEESAEETVSQAGMETEMNSVEDIPLQVEASAAENVKSRITAAVNSMNGSFSTPYGGGSGCFAFRNHVYNDVFGKVKCYSYVDGTGNLYNFLSSNGAMPGDSLWCHSSDNSVTHVMIIMGYDSSGIWVTDGKSSGKVWGNNEYCSYTSGYRATNYFSKGNYRLYKVDRSIYNSFATTSDTTPPTISNIRITDVSNTGYTVSCTVTDASGVAKVVFPTWTWYKDQDDLKSDWTVNYLGSASGSTYSFRVNTSAHNEEAGWYITHIYAYDNAGNQSSGYGADDGKVYIDKTPPVISNVKVTNVTQNGYTVTCTVTDDCMVNRVQFPTWTGYNGQDDIQDNWWSGTSSRGSASGTTYTYYVDKKDHYYEMGGYNTHIWAFDNAGNNVSKGVVINCLLGEKADLGDSFEAVIQNETTLTYLSNDSTNVSGRAESKGSNQKWKFTKLSNGYYMISSVKDGKVLSVESENVANETNILVSSWSGSPTQCWGIYKSDTNGYYLFPQASRCQVADLTGASNVNGTNAKMYVCYGAGSQRWLIKKPSGEVVADKKENNNSQSQNITIVDNSTQSFVSRMYTVALNRTAEEKGLNDWTNKLLTQQIDGAGIANGFINSAEFTNRNLNNTDYLNVLYKTFFDRKPDTGGKNYWLQQMSNGMTRNQVLSGFVNSQEFSKLCDKYGIARGTMQPNGSSIYRPGVRNYVLRMYTKALNRVGETVGVEDWTNRINTGAMSAENVAKSFFSSQEFINRNLNNSAYVETLYQTFMDRPSDASGKQYWIDKLNSGMSREQVLEGFSRSAEFSEIMSRYGL